MPDEARVTRLNPASGDSTPESTATPVDVSQIASTLAGEQPEVQQHVVDAARSEQAEAQKEAAVKDSSGDAFDPAVHSTGRDGKGVLNASGKWRRRRNAQGNTGSTKTAQGSRLGSDSQPSVQTGVSDQAMARASGKGAANLLLAISIMLGGPEFRPMVETDEKGQVIGNEKDAIECAFADYFVATGKQDIPPGWALTAVLCMYYGRRVHMPVTKSRLVRLKNWFASKWLAWRAKKRGLRMQPAAPERSSEEERA